VTAYWLIVFDSNCWTAVWRICFAHIKLQLLFQCFSCVRYDNIRPWSR